MQAIETAMRLFNVLISVLALSEGRAAEHRRYMSPHIEHYCSVT